MTTRSTAKKVLQNFHARTGLWNLFVKRAEQMDCSVDYLINEAMRLYAATHNFLETEPDEPAEEKPAAPQPLSPPQAAPVPSPSPAVPLPRPGTPRAATPSGALPRPGAPPLPRPSSPPGPPATAQAQHPAPLPRPSRPPAPPARPPAPPPPPPRPTDAGLAPASTASKRPPLILIFQGNKIPITQDQFIIGRGSKSSDLAIKDGNISRKHAAIIFHNGAYYMKDLGSTNGVEYRGKPVDSKRIDEGDVFSICGYELHFTYNP